MDVLLNSLGLKASTVWRIWLFAAFVLTTLAFVALVDLAQAAFRWSPVIVQILGWAAWFAWLGWIFPAGRTRILAAHGVHAYRYAFYWHILPGVSFGVSQMLCPLSVALSSSPIPTENPLQLALGAIGCVAGAALVWSGFHAIGLDGAGFVYEYRSTQPSLVLQGVYAWVRHPLFLGGVILSLGASVIFADAAVLLMGAVNIVALPMYQLFEDRRLVSIFGEPYATYRMAVGGFIPSLRRPTGEDLRDSPHGPSQGNGHIDLGVLGGRPGREVLQLAPREPADLSTPQREGREP